MIITLAGHVDHGKTSLVRSLTGVDTDRLAEEKRRGLTIDLGFAYLQAQQLTLGFVDVPGHHKFIHNMVAGVAAQQFALLVIAADDGPMPQSREHLQILQLLGVSRGVIALTKCDRVPAERIIAARAEIAALTRGTFLEAAQIIETSSQTGDGIDALRASLIEAAADHPTTSIGREFRLPIDRAFTVTGAGVVVTGTVHSGTVSADVSTEQQMTLFPSQQKVRIKQVRAQDQIVDSAGVGDRCALNLAGVSIEDVRRGDWLCTGPSTGSREFSISLEVLADFPRKVRHWLPVHVYHATSHTTGHIALLQEGRLAPGDRALVELITDDALLVGKDDRLILRDQGLDRTLGGGYVVSTTTASGRRRDAMRVQQLAADATNDPGNAFASHLQLGPIDLTRFQMNWSLPELELAQLLDTHECLAVAGYAVGSSTWREWRDTVTQRINKLHQADSALQGAKQSELNVEFHERFLPVILAELVADKKLIAQSGRYRPADHEVSLSPAEQKTLAAITPHLDAPQPPSLGDLSKLLRLPIPQLSKSLHPLVSKKQLVRISDSRYYLPPRFAALADVMQQLSNAKPFTVREFRDAAAIGRNVAIEMLEYCDGRGFTRRNGDTRSVIGDRNRLGL